MHSLNGVRYRKRRRNIKDKLIDYINKPREPVLIISIALYTVLIMLINGIIEDGYKAWAVQVNGKTVALVNDPAEVRKAIGELTEKKSSIAGRRLGVSGEVGLSRVFPGGESFLQGEGLKAALAENLFFSTKAAAVSVDSDVKLVLQNREEARKLLDRLKAPYRSPGTEVAFAENVAIKDVEADSSELVSVDEALAQVRKGATEIQTYRVKEGDTLWDIASSAGITQERLIAANPGMDPDHIGIGQEINLAAVKPLISVLAISRQTATEQIAFAVEEKKDSKLYYGDEKVVQQGKPGKKSVTYQVTKLNGVTVERNVLQESVLEQPTTKIVAKGSKLLLASRSGSSGRLAWPTVGSVISPFGKRGSSVHEGVDISGSIGNAVAAAASGTVVRAGWFGGYGKCVDISHGDGVITRYGHLSKIVVSSGQKIARGQLVGRVGSTGRSTGPHLHFEVRINGQPRNPMKYL
ncbi:M23 family metallopeptidase [Desulfocucumis palustris]|uniref:M23 family metallopeptidase n=1 Tax=Desulfocucumis palustris TaxID=1898651 RepID=UPI0013FDBAD9|nr:M23 family metallopeptidase [Desulfocucumis palustris]